MVPAAYTTPVAVILLVGGLLSCFAGYRLFRVVLGIYGFMLGAAITTGIMGGAASTFSLVLAAVVGGVVGAGLMIAAYFIGVGLIGAGIASLVLEAGWKAIRHTDPPTIVLVIVAVLGALAALSIVRYVVVFGTALSGAWTAILGALALAASRGQVTSVGAPEDVLVLYPLGPVAPRMWIYMTWLGLALVGIVVQLSTTSKLAGAKKSKSPKPKPAE